MPQQLTAPLTAKLTMLIRATDEGVDLSEPLYAINWFSTTKPWLYRLYNLLVFPLAKGVGASPVFKGRVTERLAGNPDLGREQLLIVRYPDGQAFVDLVKKKAFQLFSLLRTNSVKDFTFAYANCLTYSKRSEDFKARAYCIHHFRGKLDRNTLEAALKGTEVSITFAGNVIANLHLVPTGKKPREVPSVMDGVVVLEAKDKEALRRVVTGADYGRFAEISGMGFMGLIEREI